MIRRAAGDHTPGDEPGGAQRVLIGPGSEFLGEPFAAAAPLELAVLTVNSITGERLRGALSAGQSIRAGMRRDSVLRDNDVDNQTIAHEGGHYISNRLVDDATGLDTNMSGGLGEDPLTFGHISDDKPLPEGVPNSGDSTHSEVHHIGEVWATMLWECYAALLRDTEGNAPRLTFAEARDRMRDYLVAAYKLTPHSPTLLEARDALLTAALLNDPVDHARFAQAFAKRGAGVFAEAPDRFDDENHGVVESFGYGAAVVVTNAVLADDVAAACVTDGYLDDGETGRLRLTLQNIGNAPTQSLSAHVSTPTPGLTLPRRPSTSCRRPYRSSRTASWARARTILPSRP